MRTPALRLCPIGSALRPGLELAHRGWKLSGPVKRYVRPQALQTLLYVSTRVIIPVIRRREAEPARRFADFSFEESA